MENVLPFELSLAIFISQFLSKLRNIMRYRRFRDQYIFLIKQGKIFTFENEYFLPFQILPLQKILLLILQPSSFIHSFCIISVAHFAAQLTTRYVWSKISNYTLTAAHTYSKFTRILQVLIINSNQNILFSVHCVKGRIQLKSMEYGYSIELKI